MFLRACKGPLPSIASDLDPSRLLGMSRDKETPIESPASCCWGGKGKPAFSSVGLKKFSCSNGSAGKGNLTLILGFN